MLTVMGVVFLQETEIQREFFEEVWAGMIGINVPLPAPAATRFGVEGLTIWRSSHLRTRWGKVLYKEKNYYTKMAW